MWVGWWWEREISEDRSGWDDVEWDLPRLQKHTPFTQRPRPEPLQSPGHAWCSQNGGAKPRLQAHTPPLWQRPLPWQSVVQVGMSHSSPPQPSEHTHLPMAHTPWEEHPRVHCASAQSAPPHPGLQ